MDPGDRHLGAEGGHQGEAEEPGEQDAEEEVLEGGGGVFEVGAAVEGVGGDHGEGLRGDAADGVAVGEPGFAVDGGDGGHHDPGERGDQAEEDGAEDRLAPPGPVGEGVAHPGQPHTAPDRHRSGEEQDDHAPPERPLSREHPCRCHGEPSAPVGRG